MSPETMHDKLIDYLSQLRLARVRVLYKTNEIAE